MLLCIIQYILCKFSSLRQKCGFSICCGCRLLIVTHPLESDLLTLIEQLIGFGLLLMPSEYKQKKFKLGAWFDAALNRGSEWQLKRMEGFVWKFSVMFQSLTSCFPSCAVLDFCFYSEEDCQSDTFNVTTVKIKADHSWGFKLLSTIIMVTYCSSQVAPLRLYNEDCYKSQLVPIDTYFS